MILPDQVREELVLPFNDIQADFEGCTYAGPGIGRWSPDTGLSIDAVVNRKRGFPPETIILGEPSFSDGRQLSTIRFRTRAGERGVGFLHDRLRDQFSIFDKGHLAVLIPEFVTCTKSPGRLLEPYGRMVYDGGIHMLLPDSTTTETQIGDHKVGRSVARALDCSDERLRVVIRPDGENRHSISWSVPDPSRAPCSIAGVPTAIALAWQFCTGSSIQLLASEIHDIRRRILVLKRRERVVHLGRFAFRSPFEMLRGDDFLRLVYFFAGKSKEAYVAEGILDQCFDALRTGTWQGVMFLIGTCLEAVLRTLYGFPFTDSRRGPPFDRRKCVEALTSDYFSDDWRPYIVKVVDAWKRVRHRAAHPDWIRSFGGTLSSSQMKETFADLVLMCGFYGCLVRAMAGDEALLSQVPKPVSR